MVICSVPVLGGEYRSPEVTQSCFESGLGMLDRERERFAKNIAVYAGNRVAADKRGKHSLAIARRLIGLSLHLAPKNAVAGALDRRMSDGGVPVREKPEYSNEAFSEVLLARGKDLRKENANDVLFSRCLVELAALVNPDNKEAIRAMELQKIQYGEVAWSIFTED